MLQNNIPRISIDVYDYSLAIEFYSNILYNVSRYSVFPINQLIGHRGQAPPEVQEVAVNAIDLKKFLSRYPTIFKVTENDCVMLQKIISKSSDDSEIAVQFYANILKKKCLGNTVLPIKNLIGYRSLGSSIVQKCARNENELYLFLCNHSDTFDVLPGKVVTLRKSVLNTYVKNEPQPNASKNIACDSTLAVEYYSKILNSTGPNYCIHSLIGHRGQAPLEVQNIARNVKELKSFLSRFPSLFSISNDNVSLIKLSQDGPNKQQPTEQTGIQSGTCNMRSQIHLVKYDLPTAIQPEKSNVRTVIQPEKSNVRTGIQPEKSNVRTGIQPEKSNVRTGIQPEKSNVRTRIQPEKSNVRTGIQPEKSNVQTGIQPEKSNVRTGIQPEKCSPEAAVQFYANILNEKGYYGKEYPIEKLSGYKSTAPLCVQKCAKNPNELFVFFSSYPNIFTVTSRKVILIKFPVDNIVSKLQNLSLTSDDNLKPDNAIQYFVKILRRTPNSELPIAKLAIHVNEAPVAIRREVRNPEDLVKFLLKYPNTFTVKQNTFVKLAETSINSNNISQNIKFRPTEGSRNLPVDKGGTMLRYFPSISFAEHTRFSGSWEDHVLDNIILVTEEYECYDACETIKKEKVIALDCEGYNLGRGILSFIQIALVSGKVYIFDIYELPSMISCGLKEIIESDKILKVINYCRNDCLNLKGQYNVNLKYIFDVSVAFHVIECKMMSLSNFKPAGFNQICTKYGVPTNTYKDDLKFIYLVQPRYWLTRPITMKMISYAAFDVASLVPYLYIEFLKRMNPETEFAIWKLSQQMCIP